MGAMTPVWTTVGTVLVRSMSLISVRPSLVDKKFTCSQIQGNSFSRAELFSRCPVQALHSMLCWLISTANLTGSRITHELILWPYHLLVI